MVDLARAHPLGLAAGVTGVAAAVWLALQLDLSLDDAEALAARIRGVGLLGPAVLLVLLVIQSIMAPLPSQPVLMAAGFVYGPKVGFAIGWLGVALGACACFGIARALGRPFVERVARPERLSAVDSYVQGRGLRTAFLTILSLRLFAHISFDVVSYGCGLIRVPFRWFLVATGVGEVPKVFAFSYLGAGLGAGPGGTPAWLTAIIAAGVLGALVAGAWIGRRAARET